MAAGSTATTSPWATEVDEVVRGASGGMLFGVPLLFTMEVWWIGSITSPTRMLPVLAVTYTIVVLLNRTSGFRSTKDVTLRDALRDSVEALAIGVLCVAAVLVIIREITTATPLVEALGKIVYEATPFSIGVGVARHFLVRNRTEGEDEGGDGDENGGDGAGGHGAGDPSGRQVADDEPEVTINATLADVGATLLGAVFVAFNIAPTDEVPMITAAMSPAWLLVLIAASLVISYAVVFEAGFSDQQGRRAQPGIIQHPVTETVVCYLFALATAAGMLWFFQRFAAGAPQVFTLGSVIVLGLPATVGGAAGRLAV